MPFGVIEAVAMRAMAMTQWAMLTPPAGAPAPGGAAVSAAGGAGGGAGGAAGAGAGGGAGGGLTGLKLPTNPDEALRQANKWFDTLVQYGIDFAPRLVGAAVVLGITWVLAGWSRRIVANLLEHAKIDVTLIRFLSNALRWLILVLGVLACLSTFGLNVTSFIAILSAVSLAIGLALQGSLAHIASGVMLLIFRPFKVGDQVLAGGQEGVVDAIDLFCTTLDTPDRRRIIIPNGAIYGNTIVNFTHHPVRIATVRATVAAGTSAETARAALRKAAERVLGAADVGAVHEPGPVVTLADPAASANVWAVSVAAETRRLGAVVERLSLEVAAAVPEFGIAPPAPVQMVKQVG